MHAATRGKNAQGEVRLNEKTHDRKQSFLGGKNRTPKIIPRQGTRTPIHNNNEQPSNISTNIHYLSPTLPDHKSNKLTKVTN